VRYRFEYLVSENTARVNHAVTDGPGDNVVVLQSEAVSGPEHGTHEVDDQYSELDSLRALGAPDLPRLVSLP